MIQPGPARPSVDILVKCEATQSVRPLIWRSGEQQLQHRVSHYYPPPPPQTMTAGCAELAEFCSNYIINLYGEAGGGWSFQFVRYLRYNLRETTYIWNEIIYVWPADLHLSLTSLGIGLSDRGNHLGWHQSRLHQLYLEWKDCSENRYSRTGPTEGIYWT